MKKLATIFGFAFLMMLAFTTSAFGQEKIYIDESEKEFYTARQAKMMKYRNENGQKLKKVKAAPEGYQPTDDMSKMYVDEAEKEYYTPAEAKVMSYKNESGTALTQRADIPDDFKPTDDLKKKKN